MEIADFDTYPHLAAFQVRKAVEAQQKRQDRELVELFGKIEEEENSSEIWTNEKEEEQIWNLERINHDCK